jgi:hypothetical protein
MGRAQHSPSQNSNWIRDALGPVEPRPASAKGVERGPPKIHPVTPSDVAASAAKPEEKEIAMKNADAF